MAKQDTQRPRRLWRAIFALSLAMNVAVVGVVLGFGLRGGGDKGAGPRGFDIALGPIGRALEKDDRRAIAAALLNNPALRADRRGDTRAMMDDFATALRATPFSRAALQDVLEDASGRMANVQDAARAALITRISDMSDRDRAALAARVETIGRARPRN